MKAVLALAASLSVASASVLLPRQLDQIPQCALQCALGSLQSTGCETTDFACICTASAFVNGLVPCVQDACTDAEFDRTLQAAQGLCSAAGVTLSVPAGATETSAPASSSAPASTTEAPSTETTSAPTATETQTQTQTETETETETSQAPAPTTSSGNGTTTGPPTPTGTEPGAASRNTVALGGLGAIVALVAAFL